MRVPQSDVHVVDGHLMPKTPTMRRILGYFQSIPRRLKGDKFVTEKKKER